MSSAHYFSSQPAGDFVSRQLTVELAGQTVTVETAPGIFSSTGLDKGTAVLLDRVPEPRGSRVLDIGTGWGPIALTLAMKLPAARVYGVEVNERSAELTRTNAARLGLDNVEVFLPEDLDDSLRFDTIWSNPPIRVGKQLLHSILRTWLPRLAAGGSAFLVVQKNLGADSLQKWLIADLEESHPGGFRVSRFDTAKGFRILRVDREG